MSDFIRTINQADALARSYQQGIMLAVALEERLLALGFFNIRFRGNTVHAQYLNAIIPLGV